MTSYERAPVHPQAAEHGRAGDGHAGHGRRRWAGHFIEMQLAMMAGMALGGPLGISGVASVELRAALWLVAMTVPMVAWMRFRGMAWRPIAEMAASMAAPTLALLPLFWLGLLTGRSLIGLEHWSMVPAMLALMVYRRRDYGW